jgi:ADP-ribosylglycohydrolase
MAHGLVKGNGVLDLNEIASMYGEWFKSRPFDIGNTLRQAAPKAVNMDRHQAYLMRKAASRDSQSNGGLMRMIPICIWGSRLEKEEDFLTAVAEEAMLTHGDSVAIECAQAYALAVRYMMQNPNVDGPTCVEYLNDKVQSFCKTTEIKAWLKEVYIRKVYEENATKKKGWAKHAFSLAILHLMNATAYIDAMKDVLSRGGDTDTNCCIVGALLGCSIGLEGLPQEILEKMLAWTPAKGGVKRPKFLQPSSCAKDLIKKIIDIRPEKLVIKGSALEYLKAKESTGDAKKK